MFRDVCHDYRTLICTGKSIWQLWWYRFSQIYMQLLGSHQPCSWFNRFIGLSWNGLLCKLRLSIYSCILSNASQRCMSSGLGNYEFASDFIFQSWGPHFPLIIPSWMIDTLPFHSSIQGESMIRHFHLAENSFIAVFLCSDALTAKQPTQLGPASLTVCSSALIALQSTVPWASMSHSSARLSWTPTGHGFNWEPCKWVAMPML